MVGARFISLAGVVVYEMMGTYMYIDVYGGRGLLLTIIGGISHYNIRCGVIGVSVDCEYGSCTPG